MTTPHGPARATGGFTEIRELHERIDALEQILDTALRVFTEEARKRLEDELATWGDVPERIARVEDLLAPMSVDPATPEVSYAVRRGDGILEPVPTDPEERLAVIASGVPLTPVRRQFRYDGRMVVLPLPEMAS